jgi:hypothetical protein
VWLEVANRPTGLDGNCHANQCGVRRLSSHL